jgi:ribosome-associated toxin RatA of RatAB toxin-antitoxin module
MTEPLDAALRARLDRGDVVVENEPIAGTTQQRVVMRAVIEASPASVWRHIDQAVHYAEFMPRVKKAEELERHGDHVRTRTTMELPVPLKNLTATTRAKHIIVPDERYVREWRLEEGDYHVNEGAWTLTPFEGNPARTLADYRAHVVPKVPLPKSLQAMAQEKALPKLIEALRERVRKFAREGR